MVMAIIGINGRMGKKLYEYYKEKFQIYGIDITESQDIEIYRKVKDIPNKIDVIVDFSSINSKPELIYALENNILVLSGTTGYTLDEIEELISLGKGRFFWSANYSKGIFLFSKLINITKEEFELFDFIEIHAATKKDHPSGTAVMLAKELDIPIDRIQYLRIKQAPPIHELIFSSKNERISIRHEVIDTQAFIEGFDKKLIEFLGEYYDKENI